MFYTYVSLSIKCFGEALDFDENLDLLLNLTNYSHMATYVHSVMVQEITGIITKYLITRHPGLFIGMAGVKTADDVITNSETILNLIRRAALCHDMGKLAHVNVVAMYARKLYDFEFGIIMGHTNASSFIYPNNENLTVIADVINGHHKWYNGKGYGANLSLYSDKHKLINHIVSVADTIEAATDEIGRPYAKPKALPEIVREITFESGTKYSPVVAEILNDPAVFANISQCLGEYREAAYYEAYKKI
jgi:HD-GYP domain-containing protein (c-di-GMP phosphodiesterase class II)